MFKEANSLLAPWRNSGCHNTKGLIQEPNCHKFTLKEWQDSSVLTLYNEDGSQWYQFSIKPENPQHFQRNTTIGFLPFATWLAGEAPILRLVGESENWYKVEVNEKTQAIKYALKTIPSGQLPLGVIG